MEKEDIDLIKQLKDKDHHLAKLWQEHLELEKEIDTLEMNSAAGVANHKLQELKKKKLQGRDWIESILKKHRQQNS